MLESEELKELEHYWSLELAYFAGEKGSDTYTEHSSSSNDTSLKTASVIVTRKPGFIYTKFFLDFLSLKDPLAMPLTISTWGGSWLLNS